MSAKLSEYAVTIGRSSAASGRVTFTVHNTGHKVHELLVLRTNAAHGALPQNGDRVKERGAVKLVDEVEEIRPGKSASLTVRLTPGKYAPSATWQATTTPACTPHSARRRRVGERATGARCPYRLSGHENGARRLLSGSDLTVG